MQQKDSRAAVRNGCEVCKEEKTSNPATNWRKPSGESVIWAPQAQDEEDSRQDMPQNPEYDREGALAVYCELERPCREKNGPHKKASSIEMASPANTIWQRAANVA